MRLYLLGACLCLIFLQACSSPISINNPQPQAEQTLKEGAHQEATVGVFKPQTQAKETGRQSTDDDDDDDDDDLGLDVGDDDDDDDESSDDDDEEDDYFDGFFDDILGGGDDDDDDDEDDDDDVQPVVADQPVQPVQAAASTVEEVAEEATDLENQTDGTGAETAEDESLIDKDPTEVHETVPNGIGEEPTVVEPVPSNDEEDDDDDDDEDDSLDGITGDDDDDDDDDDDADDDDDDDDDDDTDLDDVIEAKRSRDLQSSPKMPAIYVTKYNRFVDNIINRINRILGKSYDPVRVKLPSNNDAKKTTKNPKKKTNKRKHNRKNRIQSGMRNKMAEVAIARSTESESREPAFILISKNAETKVISRNSTEAGKRRGAQNKANKKKNNKNKAAAKKTPKARATLFGLSSIKRDGDVAVNMMSNHTNVRTNFILGPLTLRVEREFGRGAKRELKSATATTAEMHGRLNLKIVHGGAATLNSIRVLQPKQVRVDSADNHEKTKEFVWKRSSNIAALVSKKLASATRSMLQPPPQVIQQ